MRKLNAPSGQKILNPFIGFVGGLKRVDISFENQ
jgi:hypothetical protein